MSLIPFSRFIVDEESMLPVYKPGDHVLTFNWCDVKIGDVIVFQNEARPVSSFWGAKRLQNLTKNTDSGQARLASRAKRARMTRKNHTYYIKRVYKKLYNYVYISGDNKAKSAKMEPIKNTQIVGKVVFSY